MFGAIPHEYSDAPPEIQQQVCDSVTVSGVKFLRRRRRMIMHKQRQLYGPDYHGSLQAAAADLVARDQLNTADLNTALIHYCPTNPPQKQFQVRREGLIFEISDTPAHRERKWVWQCSYVAEGSILLNDPLLAAPASSSATAATAATSAISDDDFAEDISAVAGPKQQQKRPRPNREAAEKRKRLERLQKDQLELRRQIFKERVATRIEKVAEDVFDGRRLSSVQQSAIKQRLRIEHKQELVCVAYLARDDFDAERILTQHRLKDSDGDRYVITDVYQPLAEAARSGMQLNSSREAPRGIPWEVKDCDGMNPTEHAHGQADYQRIFANAKESGLWLFTKDAHDSNGRRNFAVLCEQVLPYSHERYSEVVLAARLEPYDCEMVSKADARGAVIATWRRGPGVVYTPGKEHAPAAPDSEVAAASTVTGAVESESFDFGGFGPVSVSM